MKTMVKLAVLLSTLLLINGVALAFPTCDYEECYEVTSTLIDHPDVVIDPFFSKICLVYGDNIGKASQCGQDDVQISLFFDSMNRRALGYSDICVIYTKFHGDNNHVLTGIEYCDNERLSFRGIKTDWSNCNCY